MSRIYFSILFSVVFKIVISQTNYYSYTDVALNNTFPNVKLGSQLASDEFGKVYYVATDGRLVYIWKNGINWSHGYLSSNISTQRSKQNTGIEYKNYSLFFVNEANDLCRFYYNINSNTWTFQVLNASAPKVLDNSQITTDEFGKVYYVCSDGRICYFWKTGNTWAYGALSSSTAAQRSKQYTGLEYRNFSLFFINENSDVSRLYYSVSSNIWTPEVLNISGNKANQNSQITTDEFGKVYYIDLNGNLCVYYKSGSNWQSSSLMPNGPQAKSTASIYYFNSQIYFVGIDGKFYCDYFSDCKWEYSQLNDHVIPLNSSDLIMISNANYADQLFYVSSVDNNLHVLKPSINNQFVYIKGKKFISNGVELNLKVINYGVDLNTDDYINYWASPTISYGVTGEDRVCNSKQACLSKIQQDFLDIKNQGFNAIRLFGLGIKPDQSTTQNFIVPAIVSSPAYSYSNIQLSTTVENKLFSVMQEVFQIAQNEGLKVILLTGGAGNQNLNFHQPYASYLGRLSNHFKLNTALMAYDLYNEPGIQNLITKEDVCISSKNWYSTIKGFDSNHFITIGNIDATDVFNWDPGLLSVDFLSFHIYPFQSNFDNNKLLDSRNRVFSNMFWISSISGKINKPWIIGETGFTADLDASPNTLLDWGSETDQDEYAKVSIAYSKDMGSSGYSWWQYHDVSWGDPIQDYLGLYNRVNTAKKVITNQTFKNFNPIRNCNNLIPVNYFNPYQFSNYQYTGTIKDINGNSIENAMIYGWGSNWNSETYTYSNSTGQFTLFSNVQLFHLKASYTQKSIASKDMIDANGIPLSSNQGVLTLQNLVCAPSQLLREVKVENNLISDYSDNLAIDDQLEKIESSLYFKKNNEFDVEISSSYKIEFIEIYDSYGRLILDSKNIDDRNINVSLDNFSNGLYYFKIQTAEKLHFKRLNLIH